MYGIFHSCLRGLWIFEDRDGPDVKIKCNKHELLPLPRVKHGAHFGGAISSPSVSPRASCWVSCLCLRRAPHPASLLQPQVFPHTPGDLFLKPAHYLSS